MARSLERVIRFTKPGQYILNMLIFVGLVGGLGFLLYEQLELAFQANPQLNGVILGVLIFGIILSFRQAGAISPAVRWVEAYRESLDPSRERLPRAPSLIAAMATVLMDADQRGRLTAVSNRAILDSIGTRMDETREMNRYLIGLLIFLGLLGTFWGLLGTVNGVAQTISTLNSTAGGSEAQAVTQLIAGLEGPLAGMGTAFSSSLFGLAGSLVLGFLDLQAGQAQNRFYNDLEEWLSTMTTYASPVSGETGGAAYSEALLERTAESLQRLADEAPRERAQLISELKDELRTLTRTISRLTDDRE